MKDKITYEVLPLRPTDPPIKPVCHILVGPHADGAKGEIYLSPQLMTDREIDEAVDELIHQLEKVRKAAKQKLSKANADQLAHMRDKRP